VFFKRGKKLEYANDDKYLTCNVGCSKRLGKSTKIVGHIDEKEWEKECLRVEKQLMTIGTTLKENPKRSGLDNFERLRHAAGVDK
jgi:hypothetical protein